MRPGFVGCVRIYAATYAPWRAEDNCLPFTQAVSLSLYRSRCHSWLSRQVWATVRRRCVHALIRLLLPSCSNGTFPHLVLLTVATCQDPKPKQYIPVLILLPDVLSASPPNHRTGMQRRRTCNCVSVPLYPRPRLSTSRQDHVAAQGSNACLPGNTCLDEATTQKPASSHEAHGQQFEAKPKGAWA